MSSVDLDAVRQLIDRESIRDCLMRYCRGIDRRDGELVKSTYWPDAIDNHGVFNGNAHAFVDSLMPRLATYPQTQHALCNILMNVENAAAQCESYLIAFHRVPRDGGMVYEVMGGRYLDRFEKRAGEWRISYREVMFDWFQERPSAPGWEQGFRACTDRIGRRAPDDPVYALFGPR
jgi:hypothetical protein